MSLCALASTVAYIAADLSLLSSSHTGRYGTTDTDSLRAGLRGEMAPGFNRMNDLTVLQVRSSQLVVVATAV